MIAYSYHTLEKNRIIQEHKSVNEIFVKYLINNYVHDIYGKLGNFKM